MIETDTTFGNYLRGQLEIASEMGWLLDESAAKILFNAMRGITDPRFIIQNVSNSTPAALP